MGLLAPSTQAWGLLACSGAVQYTTRIYGLCLVRGCITTEQAERENLCDLLLVLQVLLVLWNICYFASGIKLLLVSCALIFGGVGLAGVFWAVVSLFNVNMRLYHLFWAAKI
ncbi:uncharacterized protein LOC120712254 isoform X5 [Panicum virgatum]|uniref:uncharacterized protein LOC120712254 isoform X5 n=1 Tax=Panicum virgatum TaxID=38727 RepID=UPI0019D6425D|nr:uncharacterized protein LOC120712254 isoform X5 [Panicum virgatum]